MRPPLWLESGTGRGCDRCPTEIREGDPMGWVPDTDETCCFDCTCWLEDQAEGMS